MKHKIHVKIGDTVQIIAGQYKGQVGKISRVLKKHNKVIINNCNLRTKHIKPSQEGENGKIISIEAPIHSSNIMMYSVKHRVRSRYTITFDKNKQKIRVLKKNQETI
uniref:Large ribosomal subunit protein uL24c n=1 Tax=Neogoniolithon spectabile TaxID=231755 RepID=A0A3G3MGR7_9FLOR|nr:ribosomal protein L24 [Neogoniolithon spectabile]AYR06026.1 ribosomal protein L24 [Neogoniolithon spectabile]